MEVKKILLEVQLSTEDNQLNKIFDYSLSKVFSPWFLKKINTLLKREVKVKEVNKNNENIVAWQSGQTIYVNKPVFFAKSRDLQINYLLHEFIHLLQNNRKFLFFKGFKEINSLSKRLYSIVISNLTKSLSQFLIGREAKLPTKGEEEMISYLMNNQTDWSALSEKGRIEFKRELVKSKLFKLNSDFWIRRLSNGQRN